MFVVIASDVEIEEQQSKATSNNNDSASEKTITDSTHTAPLVSDQRVPSEYLAAGLDRISVDQSSPRTTPTEHHSPVCTSRRRSPSPVPLPPSSVIRATCRLTTRSPPCGVNHKAQTEKPKIWSLADTALSKSPERTRKPIHVNITTDSFYTPQNSSVISGMQQRHPVVQHSSQYQTHSVPEMHSRTSSLPSFISYGFPLVSPLSKGPSDPMRLLQKGEPPFLFYSLNVKE